MTLSQWILFSIILAIGVLGQALLKSGLQINRLDLSTLPQDLAELLLDWRVTMAILCYSLGLILYMILLSRLELSFIYPLQVSMTIVVVSLAGIILFRESVSLNKVVGIGLMIGGIFLVNWR